MRGGGCDCAGSVWEAKDETYPSGISLRFILINFD
jgi:hypothetical protein